VRLCGIERARRRALSIPYRQNARAGARVDPPRRGTGAHALPGWLAGFGEQVLGPVPDRVAADMVGPGGRCEGGGDLPGGAGSGRRGWPWRRGNSTTKWADDRRGSSQAPITSEPPAVIVSPSAPTRRTATRSPLVSVTTLASQKPDRPTPSGWLSSHEVSCESCGGADGLLISRPSPAR